MTKLVNPLHPSLHLYLVNQINHFYPKIAGDTTNFSFLKMGISFMDKDKSYIYVLRLKYMVTSLSFFNQNIALPYRPLYNCTTIFAGVLLHPISILEPVPRYVSREYLHWTECALYLPTRYIYLVIWGGVKEYRNPQCLIIITMHFLRLCLNIVGI